MNVDFKIAPTQEKLEHINNVLTGYWQKDIWNITDSFFDDIRPEKWSRSIKRLKFHILPIELRSEIKFFFVKRLTERKLRLSTVANYGTCFKHLTNFLNTTYPNTTSFVDIAIEQAMPKWRTYLIERGMETDKNGYLSSKIYENILQQLCKFFMRYYSMQDELVRNMAVIEQGDDINSHDDTELELPPDKINEIKATITGYWHNNIWDMTNPFFDDILPNNWNPRGKFIDFNHFSHNFRDEAKFFFIKKLTEHRLNVLSALNYSSCFRKLAFFLNNSYKSATSFVNIPIEEAMPKWRTYLVEEGFRLDKTDRLVTNIYETVLKSFCNFYEDYYDTNEDASKNTEIPNLLSNTEQNVILDTVFNPTKIGEINSTLTGYWRNDIWDTSVSVFDPYRSTKNVTKKNPTKTINFNMLPIAFRNEAKFFFIKKLTGHSFNVLTALNYGTCFKRLAFFLDSSYKSATSFASIPIEIALPKWLSYLKKRGIHSTSIYEVILRQLCTFFEYYYGVRDEYEKDIWDLRNIRDTKVKITSTLFKLNFGVIPAKFRPLVKKFFKIFLKTKSSYSCHTVLHGLSIYFKYIHQYHPEWQDLQYTTRSELESYLDWYRQITIGNKNRASYILALRTFLTIIQEEKFPEAPTIPAIYLISKGDIPRLPSRRLRKKIKYAPEGVQQQLDANLEYLKPEHRSIILLLLATGWSIRDVLNLRYDTCLKPTKNGCSIYTASISHNTLKTIVPISKEVEAIIKAEIEKVKRRSTSENNPHKYLFISNNGTRNGLPPTENAIRILLNRLAKKCNIVDEQGNLYHFSSQYLGTSKMYL